MKASRAYSDLIVMYLLGFCISVLCYALLVLQAYLKLPQSIFLSSLTSSIVTAVILFLMEAKKDKITIYAKYKGFYKKMFYAGLSLAIVAALIQETVLHYTRDYGIWWLMIIVGGFLGQTAGDLLLSKRIDLVEDS